MISATTIILFVLGIVLLIAGAEMLVRGASQLAEAWGVPPLIIGLTIVAYGTGAPEFSVSVMSALRGQPDLALGNIVGSNISNVLLVLGLAAVVVPLIVSRQLVRLDVPVMIAITLLLWLLARDGNLSRWDGVILFAINLLYMFFLFRVSKRDQSFADEVAEIYLGHEIPETDTPAGTATATDATTATEAPTATGAPTDSRPAPNTSGVAGGLTFRAVIRDVAAILVGLVLLVLGSNWLVSGAVAVAQAFKVSELIIGLTIVAVGTSLPEIATSVIACIRGQRDIAVGNVVGSNIFNVLAVLGLTCIIAPKGIEVPSAAINFDLLVMLAAAAACLPIFFTGHSIDRWEGALFLGYYIAYVLYLVLSSSHHAALPAFSQIMLVFVVPLTVLTLAVVLIRTLRAQQGDKTASG